jgi:hypothetical protein
MNAIQRRFRLVRQRAHLIGRKVPEAVLNAAELIEDLCSRALHGVEFDYRIGILIPVLLKLARLHGVVLSGGVVLICLAAVPALAADIPKYTGPGSCSSPSCHGGVQPRATTSVQQNEYSTWVIQDKHAQSFAVLSNPISVRIAKTLGLPSAATAPRCLSCHSLNPPTEDRARMFDTSDGVSCESCHGPASNWLGPHTTRDWKHEQSVAAGMHDLRDLTHRTEQCLSCHLGTPEKTVDHELIAAGHPDLYFELASFSAVMPRHWKPKKDEDAWMEVKELANGQAVQLREEVTRLTRAARSGVWPEYAELDCFACHHSLTAAKDSWQQERGYTNRKPGNPPWNISRFVVLRQIARELDRPSAQQLEGEINRLYALVSTIGNDRTQVATAADRVNTLAAQLEQRVKAGTINADLTRRLMKDVASDGQYISEQGERAAEQSAMALDSMFVVYSKNVIVANAVQVRAAIQSLFKQVENPSAYNAFNFAQQMSVVNGLLP